MKTLQRFVANSFGKILEIIDENKLQQEDVVNVQAFTMSDPIDPFGYKECYLMFAWSEAVNEQC